VKLYFDFLCFLQVQCQRTDLFQIDSFQIKPSNPVNQSGTNSEDRNRLHTMEHWRSVIEIIAQDQIREFANHPYFLLLIMDKWQTFAMNCHMLYRCLPFLLCLVLYVIVALMVQSDIQSVPDQAVDFTRAGCADGQFNISGGSLQFYCLLVTELILYFGCSIWLFSQGLQIVHVSLSDLDSEHDMNISSSDVRLFVFNNLESLLDIATAVTLCVAGVSRFFCSELIEIGALSLTGIFLFCNFLNSLLPYQHLAAMIITLFNMLFGDVAAFLIVFIIVLSGFSFAVDLLLTTGQLTETNHSARDGIHSLGSTFTRLINVALGDGISAVNELTATSILPDLVNSVLLVWVVLCNILLLNFLIAMMGDTFNKRKDTYEIWIFPFARKVLQYEKKLYKRASYDTRLKKKQAAYRFGQR
jgi:hypothetical protein